MKLFDQKLEFDVIKRICSGNQEDQSLLLGTIDRSYFYSNIAIEAFDRIKLLAMEKMQTQLKKYNVAFTETAAENKKLKKKNAELAQSLEAATKTSVLKELRDVQLKRDYEDTLALLERIPKEVIEFYQTSKYTRKDHENRNESR